MFFVVLLLLFFFSLSFVCCLFFFKQKTAYELRISDWSSDVCSSDLGAMHVLAPRPRAVQQQESQCPAKSAGHPAADRRPGAVARQQFGFQRRCPPCTAQRFSKTPDRSEEHTSELQSLMRISYAVFCLKNKKNTYT